MHTVEPMAQSWPGTFPDRRQLPQRDLRNARLTFRHDAADAAAALAEALRSFAGGMRRKRSLFGKETLEWSTKDWNLSAKAGADSVALTVAGKLKPRHLQELVQALAAVPGAQGLGIEGNAVHVQVGDADDSSCGSCH